MKKALLLFAVGFATHSLQAQVGINTTTPKGTLDLSYESTWDAKTPQGLNLPNVTTAQRKAFENVQEGMLVYNTERHCVEVYKGTGGIDGWQCLPDAGSNQSQKITVEPSDFDGTYVNGAQFTSGNKVNFTLKNNGFTAITDVDFSDAVKVQNPGSTTVSVKPGQHNSVTINGGESKLLAYILEGTPSTGTLTATFDKLGLQANQTHPIGLADATLQAPKDYYFVALEYNGTIVDGEIAAGGQKEIKIPYTGAIPTNGGYSAYEEVVQLPKKGGGTHPIKLYYPAGNFSGATGTITAYLKNEEATVYQAPLQTPGQQQPLSTYNITLNGNPKTTLNTKVIGGIPDKKFTTSEKHKFIYLPVEVTAPNGYSKTWLNMNLGAEAAKIGSPKFNPTMTKYASTGVHTDQNLYGSLYQWQRPSDGHEFRYSPTTTTTANSWQATSPSGIVGKFIVRNDNWVSNGSNDTSGANAELWQSDTFNNPCPTGYHVPTKAEWEDFHAAVTGSRDKVSNSKMWNQTLLPNFAAAGFRFYINGRVNTRDRAGVYWSSVPFLESRSWALGFYEDRSDPDGDAPYTYGYSVRCLKD